MFLVRVLGSLALLGWQLFGQEEAVGWDPRETGELTLNWETVLIGLLLALACCGVWKLLMWLLESRRAAVNWAKARIWWPSTMLLWGWVLLAVSTRNESWGSVFDAVLFVFGLLNFPAIILGVLVEYIRESVHAPVWVQVLAGSLTLWSGAYVLVCLAEWRAWMNVPVSLDLSGPRP